MSDDLFKWAIGGAVADAFKENDQQVWKTEKLWDGMEMVQGEDGKDKPCRIIKFVWRSSGVKLGIAGVAVPDDLSAW